MEEAWETIKHPKVTVTIDTFQWGFVCLGMKTKGTFYHEFNP
jgi:hypothetical protein